MFLLVHLQYLMTSNQIVLYLFISSDPFYGYERAPRIPPLQQLQLLSSMICLDLQLIICSRSLDGCSHFPPHIFESVPFFSISILEDIHLMVFVITGMQIVVVVASGDKTIPNCFLVDPIGSRWNVWSFSDLHKIIAGVEIEPAANLSILSIDFFLYPYIYCKSLSNTNFLLAVVLHFENSNEFHTGPIESIIVP